MLTKPSWPVTLQNQLVQELPFRPGVAAGLDRLHELLHAAFGVGEGAALLGVGAAGQQVMRQPGRLVRQNVAHDQRLQLAEQVRADAVPGHVFAEHDQRLDAPAADAFGDLRQVRRPSARRQMPVSRAPFAVRIPVRVHQQPVAFARARDRIGQRAELSSASLPSR